MTHTAPTAIEALSMLLFLDWFFVIFHSVLTLFNFFGWIWKKTRRIHLIAIGLTFFSWGGLGLFYGFGYCPLTDWHWQVKRNLGETGLPDSYIKYYVDQITGLDTDPIWVDATVVGAALIALALSIWLNWRDYRNARGATVESHMK